MALSSNRNRVRAAARRTRVIAGARATSRAGPKRGVVRDAASRQPATGGEGGAEESAPGASHTHCVSLDSGPWQKRKGHTEVAVPRLVNM